MVVLNLEMFLMINRLDSQLTIALPHNLDFFFVHWFGYNNEWSEAYKPHFTYSVRSSVKLANTPSGKYVIALSSKFSVCHRQ